MAKDSASTRAVPLGLTAYRQIPPQGGTSPVRLADPCQHCIASLGLHAMLALQQGCCIIIAGAEVICQYAGIVGPTQHDMLTAVATAREPNIASICGASISAACRERYNVLKSLYDAGNTQFQNAETDARDRTNSIIFNAFIFCQVRGS